MVHHWVAIAYIMLSVILLILYSGHLSPSMAINEDIYYKLLAHATQDSTTTLM